MPNNSEYSFVSPAVKEIVSNKPSFLVRYGIVLFTFLLAFIMLVCWFIKYPDIVNGKALLSAINPPKEVICNTTGKLIKLFVQENDSVQIGTSIGFVEAIGNHEDVETLEKNIKQIQKLVNENKFELIKDNALVQNLSLGELQINCQVFTQALLNFKAYQANGFYQKKKVMLAKDMQTMKKLDQNFLLQKNFSEQDLALSQKTYNANQQLNAEKVISDFDYRVEESKLIGKKATLPQITSGLINNEMQKNAKQKEIAELDNTIAQQKIIFMEALNTFANHIAEWEKKYILKATTNGKIYFANFIQENIQLKIGQTICFINPFNSNYYVQVDVPQYNFGKINIGQKVLLKLPSYPFEEYGALVGNIEFISHIPTDSGYKAKIKLINGLNTTNKKQIIYSEGLQANAEIITKDLRLLQRFYYNLANNIKR